MEPIILASASARRQDILRSLNIPFTIRPADIDETVPKGIKADKASEYIALQKVKKVISTFPPSQEIGWILAADTTIVMNGKVFGKPKDVVQAEEYIRRFQGKSHKVVTSIVLYNGQINDFSVRTSINTVTFAPMTDEEIAWYLDTSEWHGVAGGYRIQGKASLFISRIDGTESSVMGLPIFELYDILREQNYHFL